MRKAAALLALALAAFAAEAQSPRALAAQLDEAIRAEERKDFFGFVLVARGARVILDRGYGDTIGPDSRFWIASVARQFVAAAILDQVDRGRVDLADPVSRFFPDAPADKRDITVLELLTHTSGLAPADSTDGARNRDAAVRAIFAQPAGPRGRYRDSSDNYQLAAAIVEVASGAPYRDTAARLWSSAGLLATGFAGDMGVVYVARTRGERPERIKRPAWGAQGVYSNARDLWRWHTALRAGRVISKASAERMFRGVVPIGEGQAALGWFVGSDASAEYIFTRGDEDWGPSALVYFYPATDTLVVILSHAGNASGDLSWSRAMLAKLLPMLR